MMDAFRKAQEDAREEHGHEQGYSGYINNCGFCGDRTRDYEACKTQKQKDDFIEKLIANCNNDVYGITLKAPKPNKLKVKSKVILTPQKGARKWETRYVAFTLRDDKEICSEKTQGAAIKKARAHTEKTQERTYLTITKVLTKGNSSIGHIEYKSSNKETLGLYLFVGDARC
ncbi:MAG: hypothetical protein WCN92_02865 [Eubacteriales bacterium]